MRVKVRVGVRRWCVKIRVRFRVRVRVRVRVSSNLLIDSSWDQHSS